VVSRNFCQQRDWTEADLRTSPFATVLDLANGHAYMRGKRNTWRALPRPRGLPMSQPLVQAGSVLRLEIDQRRNELTVELVSAKEELTVTLEDIPAEVTVAVGLGCREDHRVRILGFDERPADSPFLQEKHLRDLWDLQNRVQPLRSDAAQRVGATGEATANHEQIVHEAMVREAARLGEDVQAAQAAGAAADR